MTQKWQKIAVIFCYRLQKVPILSEISEVKLRFVINIQKIFGTIFGR